jgi:hypothetical protein
MPGGLGAILQQPGGAPKGASPRSIQSILDTAKRLSDRQLADVLEGKSLDVPQYVAMTEAMGRKSLRTAMQGAQAQQQMRQPSVKDKLLAEEAAAQMPAVDTMGNVTGYAGGGAIDMNEGAGIAGLPASNMDSMDMASGGIVAFQDNPDQPVKVGMPETGLTEEEKKQLAQNDYMRRVQAISSPGEAISKWWSSRPSSQEVWEKGRKARTGEIPMIVGDEPTVKGKMVNAGLATSDTPIRDVQKVAAANANKVYAADTEDANAGIGMRAYENMLAGKGKGDAKSNDGLANLRRSQLMGTDTGTGLTPEKRVNPFGELKADLPDYEKVKNQGLGEALMAFSGALFGNYNLSQAMAQGLPTLAKISGATRKEVGDLKKDYNAQQLNIAKANELFEQGQEDKAFKYLKQSQDHAYHMQTAMAAMASATKPSGQAELFKMVQKENPGMSALDIISSMAGAKNESKSDQALRDAYIKSPYLQAMYPNINDYIKKNTPAGATMSANAGNFSAVYGPDNKRIQ